MAESSTEAAHPTVQPTQEKNASLSRALLSLSSLEAQQRALHCILYSMQIKLCRDAVAALLTQSGQTRDGISEDASALHSDQHESSLESLQDACPVELNWIKLLKHKETAALWELLKLANSDCKEDSSQTKLVLSNAILGTSNISMCFVMLNAFY